ncbi:MSMEG_0570 family nitrogen starvation response protein [Nocardioides acrostichi]|uniref:MSMEG_0570 family nitrogen starvation response protein n=1 Tax=Nocardioides acrostichi TaxID=2784339 RepID=A0A930UXE3_9ACTN|nr:MSMEG_0570 family nitrogen starvation response protein [Nocardioides acrostichi]MBF4160825.1 MSMEG_0570 family nitrogen starvation response protein [Nocardioides acrostichi]
MPEMTVTVRWPDGRIEECYSPSLVMHDHLEVGARYSVVDFTVRSTHALDLASERVRARFGFACTSATASAEQIRRSASSHRPDDLVEVVRMWPPLPQEQS